MIWKFKLVLNSRGINFIKGGLIMYFTVKHGIYACQLGSGDVMVSDAELIGISPGECVSVVFGECKKGEIDRALPEFKDKLDYAAGVRFKLLFTNPKSIEVVINVLKKAKVLMEA